MAPKRGSDFFKGIGFSSPKKILGISKKRRKGSKGKKKSRR